ncbi:MAG: phage integrase SAM-like domain-containing protein [Dysgonamonadaceae bacterium]|nr:phage integrase SAM-like domain-containing protein [Dysgonamonadaceae bacterium]
MLQIDATLIELFDKKFHSKLFFEIDIKFVRNFDIFLQKRGCSSNTRNII